jgi:type IV secretion system protein VirB1
MALMEFALVAALCAPDVHVSTLSAIVMHESRGAVYAIGVNGGSTLSRQPQTLAEAVQTAERLRAEGYDFDAGLGQINVRNLDWLGMSIPDLFNPCKNLRGAAHVLRECYSRAVNRFGKGQPALHAALSCYNSGDFQRGLANGYVQKVAARLHVTVPALQPESVATGTPVQIQRIRPQRLHRQTLPVKRPNPDESTDAFATAGGDAFAQKQ